MRHSLIPLAFGLGASATALQQQRYAECTLEIDTQDVGNARLASSFEATSLVLDPDSGVLTDNRARSCAWDKDSKLNCNGGYPGDKGWRWERGELKHEGCNKFAACPFENKKEWDIYKYKSGHEHKCKPIHLKGHCGEPSHIVPYVPLGPKYDSCAKKCQPEKPSCFKSCEKKCQPSPPPAPKPCSKCKPWNWGCKKNCQPEHHWPEHHHEHPHPPPPPAPKAKCCAQCDKWDGECFKTCYPPSAEDARIEYWKPHPVPEYHPRVHPKPSAPVVPCHKCHPKKPECNKSCKPSPCHKCRPEHKGCKKTCKKPAHIAPPYPWVHPWPKTGPVPKPFPTICELCKPKEPKCHKSCISRAGVQRFIDAWEADITPEVAERLSTEEMFEKVQEHLENATSEESAENEPWPPAAESVDAEAEDSEKIEKRDEPISRAEAGEAIENIESINLADQCRCPEKEHKCFKQCHFEEAPKKVVSCSDCRKPGCPKAKKCQHVRPKPCNHCNKDNKCQKTCFKPAPPPPAPKCEKPCNKCEAKNRPCNHCNKPLPPKPSCEKPCNKCEEKKKPCNHCNKPLPPPRAPNPWCEKPCSKCEQARKPCNHCNKPLPPPPAPTPVPCWECNKGDVECYKSCFIPEHHDQPKPFCCNSCHKENKSCFDRCDKSCKPYPPPPAPPKPPVVSCDQCGHKDFGCLETCFVKPEVLQTKRPDEKTKCCLEGCKKDDWACQNKCWAEQHKKYNIPHGKPVENKSEYHGPPASHEGGHGGPPQGYEARDDEIHNGPPGAEFPAGYKPIMPEIPAGFKPVAPEKPLGYVSPAAAPKKPAGYTPIGGAPGAPTGAAGGPTVYSTVVASTAAPSSKATSSKSVTAPVASAPAPAAYKPVQVKLYSGQSFGGCPANTNGDHQFPAAQQSIPVNIHTKILGSGAQINPTTSTVFTFNIPKSWEGKTCSVYFAYPKPSDHKYNDKGSLSFDVTAKPGNGANIAVQKYAHVNDVKLNGGATYWVADHACTAGEISFEVSSKDGLDLSFPKDKGVGPYVRAC